LFLKGGLSFLLEKESKLKNDVLHKNFSIDVFFRCFIKQYRLQITFIII
jgi:hypothetical protein